MNYKSPFAQIASHNPEYFRPESCGFFVKNRVSFTGSMHDLVGRLTFEDVISRAVDIPRFVRAAVNYDGEQRFNLVQRSLNLSRQAYQNSISEHDYIDTVCAFTGIKPLDCWNLLEKEDPLSWLSNSPNRTKLSAQMLNVLTTGSPLLLISLAHGSTRSAIDLSLTYSDMTGEKVTHYPVRYSRKKLGDASPVLNDIEKKYLMDCARHSRVVIFDDDAPSGNTLYSAQDYFQNLLGVKCLPRTNIN